jgi:hypothetical protein
MANLRISDNVYDKLRAYTKNEGVKVIDTVDSLIIKFLYEKVDMVENINFDEDVWVVFKKTHTTFLPNSIFINPLEFGSYGNLYETLYDKCNANLCVLSVTDDFIMEEAYEFYKHMNAGKLFNRVKLVNLTLEEMDDVISDNLQIYRTK